MTRFSDIPDITACPHCDQLYSQPRIMSFNDFYDSYYLDGYTDRIIASLFTELVQCANCNIVFNRKELINIEASHVASSDKQDLQRIEQAGIEHYFTLASQINDATTGKATIEDELSQRLELMWQFNHPFRVGYRNQEAKQVHHLKYSVQAKENELRIMALLTKSEKHLLIKADILRRHQRFSEAKQIFRKITSPSSQHVRGLLSVLCTRMSTAIVNTSFDVDPTKTKCVKIDEGRYYLSHPQGGKSKTPIYLTIATSSRFSFKELFILSSLITGTIYFLYVLVS